MSHAVKLSTCPNCGTDLTAAPNNFCPECGQPNHDVNVTFGHVLEEALEGVFHFDSKLWRTFKELLFHPGKLTVDFLAGRRAAFVPPIRLYIFLSVVFFFLLSHQHASFEVGDPEPAVPVTAAGRAAAPTSPPPSAVTGDLIGYQKNEKGIRYSLGKGKSALLTKEMLMKGGLLRRLADGNPVTTDSLLLAQKETPNWWNRLIIKRIARSALTSEEEVGHTALRNISAGMFILMPLFALLIKLFYRRQRPFYIQHLLFSVHLHCFFFLLFSLALLLRYVLPDSWSISWLVVLLTWAYWVLALRRYSGQSLGRTLWKSSLLFGGYLGMLVLFVIGVTVVSLAMF